MNLLPFAILLFCLPFGTAIQSVATGIVAIWLLIQGRSSLKSLPQRLSLNERRAIGLLLIIALLQMGATLLNPANPTRDVFSFFMGFAPLMFLPSLFILRPKLEAKDLTRLEWMAAGLMLMWAVVVVSQSFIGWKIQGVEIITGDHFRRSQGFYSHPLTLAYVALMIWPLSLVLICQNIRSIPRLILLVGNLALLYYSASRTAQAVALLASLGFLFHYFKGKSRWFVLLGLVIALAGVFSTDNMVSKRFKSMPTQISEEKESRFADDRIAFWAVHYLMVKERPLMGHGINLDRPYRVPYYEMLGLHDFKKAYEAHNQILQLAAEGGLVAALAFIIWLGTMHFNWLRAPRSLQNIRDLMIICLFFGGLTQNAYFDGEVRYAIMTLMGLAFAQGYAGLGTDAQPRLESESTVTESLPS